MHVLQVGKLADLVIWKPSFFGAKPEMVIKGGEIAWANMGDPNASIPTPQPVSDDTHLSLRACFSSVSRDLYPIRCLVLFIPQ